MTFKIIGQYSYNSIDDTLTLCLDKELPMRWFGGEVFIDEKPIIANLVECFADEVKIYEKGNYIGKELIIPKF